MSKLHRLAAIGTAVVLAGCAVGPDYKRPEAALDAAFIGTGAKQLNSATVDAATLAQFWRGFNDAELNALVERALQVNYELRIAQARLQESRAISREADAQLWPSIGVQGNATRGRAAEYTAPGTTSGQRTGNTFDAFFIANWELDLFGRARRAGESAAAQVQASEAGVGAARTAVAAEVASSYFQLRGLQQSYALNDDALRYQRESLDLTRKRLEAGRATQLDLERARGLVASTEATLPTLQSAIERQVLRLATLTAQPPRPLREQLAKPAPLPPLPLTDLAALPVGTPLQWLERRPDIAAAERRLASATADIGVAKAALYPSVSLTGLLGLAAARWSLLDDAGSRVWSVGAGLNWTVLDFGRLRARVDASDARAQAALAGYEQTLALALEETEGALTRFSYETQRTGRLAEAADAADAAAKLARLRYEVGVSDFLSVLDAERELVRTRDLFVQAQTSTASTLVDVYRALGGGWTAGEPPLAAR